jgi:hypothetical protein
MNIGAIIAGSFVTASGVACLFLANYNPTIPRLRAELA